MSKAPEERSLSLYEAEKELLDAALRAQDGDETALAVIPEYLNYSAEKRDRVATAFRLFEKDEAFVDSEIERLQLHKARLQKARGKLENRVISAMRAVNTETLEGRTSRLAIRTNPPSVQITNEKAIPAPYKRVTQTVNIDKTLIARALKNGDQVPGAELITDKVRLEVR